MLLAEMQGTLFSSSKYKSFIQDRDRVLEQILLNTQTDLSRILYDLLMQVQKELAHLLLFLEPHNAISLAHTFDQESAQLFNGNVPKFVDRIKRMRRAVYILSYLGEQEAIGQAVQKRKQQTPQEMKKLIADAENAPTLLDQPLEKRIWASVMKLRSKILDRFRSALVTSDDPREIMASVKAVFPKIVQYKRPPRELKPIREADKGPDDPDNSEYSYDFISQEDWNEVTDAYKATELPPSRFDNAEGFDPEAGYMKYNWEVEQDATDDFVQQVRTGQVDAANELGIEEFVWVAIIDNKTDDCCLERNGKTTSEIESGLESGDIDADLCDATSPPAHPNCRCQLAPVSSTDEVEGPDWKSFNEWLDT